MGGATRGGMYVAREARPPTSPSYVITLRSCCAWLDPRPPSAAPLKDPRSSPLQGERLADFACTEESQQAQLSEPHVAALRIYTTACFRAINDPLRDHGRKKPHPYPATVFFLTDAIKRLRAVHAHHAHDDHHAHDAHSGEHGDELELWRGDR